jgi:hypothetical protein
MVLNQRHCFAGDRRGWRPCTPKHPSIDGLTKKAGLLADDVPLGHHLRVPAPARGRPQTIAVDHPPRPVVVERTKIAITLNPKQPHDSPRHTMLAGVPHLHGTKADTEELRATLLTQKGTMA